MKDNYSVAKIKVIGVGGGGGNAINDMQQSGISGVEFVAVNTDVQDLNKSLADVKFQIGEKRTKGMGAGAEPEVGREAAEEDIENIRKMLEGVDMAVITAGMGGGTGTGASPVIAAVAKEMGILTIAVVTKPFSFEGKKRANNAEIGIANLKKHIDSLVIISNDKIRDLPDKNITIKGAFHEANQILRLGVKGISDLVTQQGFINLDFADIISTMKDSGAAVFGFGEASGEDRAAIAKDQALQSPLLERTLLGAGKLLINISGNDSVGLEEARYIAEEVKKATGMQAEDVKFGITFDESLGDKIQVIIIANNFSDEIESEDDFIDIGAKKDDISLKKEENLTESLEDMSEFYEIPPFMRGKK